MLYATVIFLNIEKTLQYTNGLQAFKSWMSPNYSVQNVRGTELNVFAQTLHFLHTLCATFLAHTLCKFSCTFLVAAVAGLKYKKISHFQIAPFFAAGDDL